MFWVLPCMSECFHFALISDRFHRFQILSHFLPKLWRHCTAPLSSKPSEMLVRCYTVIFLQDTLVYSFFYTFFLSSHYVIVMRTKNPCPYGIYTLVMLIRFSFFYWCLHKTDFFFFHLARNDIQLKITSLLLFLVI